MVTLTEQAETILETRYYLKDSTGKPQENAEQMFRRVANALAEVETKYLELRAEYDAQEYARNRETEYPSIQELVVALYDTDDKSAVEAKRAAVKLKYPKP